MPDNLLHGPWPSKLERQMRKADDLFEQYHGRMSEVMVMGYTPNGGLIFDSNGMKLEECIKLLKDSARFLERLR